MKMTGETSPLHSSSLTRELSILRTDDLPLAVARQPGIGPGEAVRQGPAVFVFLRCGFAALDHGHIVAVAGREETDSGIEQPAICLGLALVGVQRHYVRLGVARAIAATFPESHRPGSWRRSDYPTIFHATHSVTCFSVGARRDEGSRYIGWSRQ